MANNMAQRITEKDLQAVVNRINRIAGTPPEPYAKNADGKGMHPCANSYHLSFAYGGVMLAQMSDKEGCTGISAPLGSYHRPKRELYDQMQAYISGLEAAK
jgi:hypothetical protein